MRLIVAISMLIFSFVYSNANVVLGMLDFSLFKFNSNKNFVCSFIIFSVFRLIVQNAEGVSGEDISQELKRGINVPIRELEIENMGKTNVGSALNSLKTVAKGKLNVTTQVLLLKRFS